MNKDCHQFCKDIKCPSYNRNKVSKATVSYLMWIKDAKYICACSSSESDLEFDLECLLLDESGNIRILDICEVVYPDFIIDKFKILCAKIKNNI